MATHDHSGSPSVRVMQSPLGRARGAGSAHSGSAVWAFERITSVVLVPLSLWFVYVALRLSHADYATTRAFIASPAHAVLLLALIGAMFWHLAMGLSVVVEDYVRGHLCKFFYLLAIRAGSVLLALLAALSVLKIAI